MAPDRAEPVPLQAFQWGNTLRDNDRERLIAEITADGREPDLTSDSQLFAQWLRS